jgi:hypothetical protein
MKHFISSIVSFSEAIVQDQHGRCAVHSHWTSVRLKRALAEGIGLNGKKFFSSGVARGPDGLNSVIPVRIPPTTHPPADRRSKGKVG